MPNVPYIQVTHKACLEPDPWFCMDGTDASHDHMVLIDLTMLQNFEIDWCHTGERAVWCE